MKRPWILVALLLALGLAGSAVALKSREGNPQFTSRQQSLTPVAAVALERLLRTTSDPRPGLAGPGLAGRVAGRARGAHCTSASAGSALGNPWSCLVRYPTSPRVRYRVTVHSDRSIQGSGQPAEGPPVRGALVVKGCCVAQAGQ